MFEESDNPESWQIISHKERHSQGYVEETINEKCGGCESLHPKTLVDKIEPRDIDPFEQCGDAFFNAVLLWRMRTRESLNYPMFTKEIPESQTSEFTTTISL